MYFTNTPSLNSMEAIMQRPPGGNQRDGGRFRRLYPFSKADCDCRLCLYHRKKKGCAITKRSDPQKGDQYEKNSYRIGDAGAEPTPYPTGTLYAGIQRVRRSASFLRRSSQVLYGQRPLPNIGDVRRYI